MQNSQQCAKVKFDEDESIIKIQIVFNFKFKVPLHLTSLPQESTSLFHASQTLLSKAKEELEAEKRDLVRILERRSLEVEHANGTG